MSESSRSFRKVITLKKAISKLFLDADIADIIVEPHDEPNIVIYGYALGGYPPSIDVSTEDDIIRIKLKRSRREGRLYTVKVKMIMPPDMVSEGLNLSVNIGDIRIDGLPIDNLYLSSSNGDILLGGISSNIIHASTLNGDILLRGGEYRKSMLSTVNGDIRIEVLMEKGYRLEASTNSGKIKLGIPMSTSAEIIVSTIKGGISISNRDKFKKIEKLDHEYHILAGDGDAMIKLETINGDVAINLLKEIKWRKA